MHCPKCGGFLREVEYEGALIHTCDACGGELIRPEAIRTVVQRRDMRFGSPLTRAMAGKSPAFGVPAAESCPALSCPSCHRPMQPMNYGGDTGIFIDRCTGCGTMFLEHEELEKIQILIEQWEDAAPDQLRGIAGELERKRRETAESTSRAFAGSRFAFINAVMNRLLDAA
jgi:Zn-finger nucleic acid-binding protein